MTITTPVPIGQDQQEFTQLLELYRERQPRRVLEIGTWHGGTLYHWLTNASPGGVVVAVDDHHTNAGMYHAWQPPDVELVTIQGDSHNPDTIDQAAQHGPYDWIFIDAGHTYHDVTADWHNYHPMAAPDAIIAFHDITPTNDPDIDVAALWLQLAPLNNTIELTEPGGRGIGVIYLNDEG